MSIKTRVKKLEQKSNRGYGVVVPTVSFFDTDWQLLGTTSGYSHRPEGFDRFSNLARSASAEIEGLEPITVKLERDEDSSVLVSRIDAACQEAYRASGLGGICLSWYIPFL